ncbi:hypothetical protein FRC04_004178 [Tulasnella sp. 424]|nr:hypothetical protein FRC04_004178 [Tulasnella sp. 424]
MPPTPTYVLQLSTEELWEIIDHITNPLDILTLSLVSKRFAEVYRDDSVWRRHLTLGGWNVDAIIRHSRTEYEDRQAEGIWVNLARAACARWHVLRPGYDQKPSTWMSRFQGWRLWKRVVWPDYIRKLDAVTSEIDSDSHFFEETESVARFLASRRPENFEDEWTGYRRLMVIARYMYHGKSAIAFVRRFVADVA